MHTKNRQFVLVTLFSVWNFPYVLFVISFCIKGCFWRSLTYYSTFYYSLCSVYSIRQISILFYNFDTDRHFLRIALSFLKIKISIFMYELIDSNLFTVLFSIGFVLIH